MDLARQPAASEVLSSDPTVLLEQTKELVTKLYNPRDYTPEEIKYVQALLQAVQRRPEGWQVADGLLEAGDTNHRFFGALTFTVKINQSWNDLSESGREELKTRLMQRFMNLVNDGEQLLVIRKLTSALIAYFYKNGNWRRAIWDVAVSLGSRDGATNEQYLAAGFEGTLSTLNEKQIQALLEFSTTMATEAVKNCNQIVGNAISDNVRDAFCLCEFVLRHVLGQVMAAQSNSDNGIGVQALESYRAWLDVRATVQIRDSLGPQDLSNAMERVVQCLPVEGLTTKASEILTDLLENGDSLLKDIHLDAIMRYISSDAGRDFVVRHVEGDSEEDVMTFMELVLGFCAFRRESLLLGTLDKGQSEILLSYLDSMFRAPGFPGVEDRLAPMLLDWWAQAADDVQEMTPDENEEDQLLHARQVLANAILNCLNRLVLPPKEEMAGWNDDDRAEFHAFRRNSQDLLLAVYPILGDELIQMFQERARLSLESDDWKMFEVVIFCLGQLSEAIDGNDRASQHLIAVISHPKFEAICTGLEISTRVRHSLVEMLGRFETIFKQNINLIPRVLTFLFSSLEVPNCTATASRSISSLCKTCRGSLSSELPVFLDLLDRFQQSPLATAQSLERVVEGVAAVIQALPTTNEEKAAHLERLSSPFINRAMTAQQNAAANQDYSVLGTHGHTALLGIAGIGRGWRADSETIVDLEDGDDTAAADNSFWTSNAFQRNLIQFLHWFVEHFSITVDIAHGICEILKAGFTEKSGPFVLPPRDVTLLLTRLPLNAVGAADVVMSTASAFLASYQANASDVTEEAGLLIIHVYQAFVWMMSNPNQNDPEISSSGLGFLTRLLPKYQSVLFSLTGPPPPHLGVATSQPAPPPVLQTILEYAIQTLRGPEPLPLRAAAQFWTAVLNLPPNSSPTVSEAVSQCLPALCTVLMTQLSGGCARSDISHLTDVLKKILFKHQGAARPHLANALASLPGPRASSQDDNPDKDKERFLEMLLKARGTTATNDIVRQYWIKCRGTGFAYTS